MIIYLLDKQLNKIAVIDEYDSIIWTEKLNAYGDFELVIPANGRVCKLIKEDYYLSIPKSTNLMIVESIEHDNEVEHRVVVKGRSLESILKRRIVWQKQSFSDKIAIDIIQELIAVNIVSPIEEARILSILFYEIPEVNRDLLKPLSKEYYGDELYSAIKSLCDENSLIFKINYDMPSTLSPSTIKRRKFRLTIHDIHIKTYISFISELGELKNIKSLSSIEKYKNVVLVNGQYGTSVSSKDPNITELDRREMFYDAGELHPNETLESKGNNELRKYEPIYLIDGDIDPNCRHKYNVDFFIGDVVNIVDDTGRSNEVMITEYTFSNDKSGYKEYPTFSHYVRPDINI